MIHWIYLLVAGLLEVAWVIGLKYTDGFTRLWPSVLTMIGMIASVVFLSLSVQKLPLGTGYVIWTGIGAVGATVLGIVLFDEPVSAPRILFLTLIVAAIVGLKLTSGH